MAALAPFLAAVLMACAAMILKLGDGFEVGRGGAVPGPAQVVNVEARRDGADKPLVHQTVNVELLAVLASGRVTSARHAASPEKAAVRLDFKLGENTLTQ